MPELPEVEVTRRRIAPLLVGRTIARVRHDRAELLLPHAARACSRGALAGRRVERARRGTASTCSRRLDDGARLLLHLGMTGQLFARRRRAACACCAATARRRARARGAAAGLPPDAHTHLSCASPTAAARCFFRDARKFGKVQLLAPGDERRAARAARRRRARAASARRCSPRRASAAASRSRPCCSTSRVLAGVGNIYADEALFRRAACGRRAARGALDARGVRRARRRLRARAAALDRDRRLEHQRLRAARRQRRRLPGRAPGVRRARASPAGAARTPIVRIVIGQRSARTTARVASVDESRRVLRRLANPRDEERLVVLLLAAAELLTRASTRTAARRAARAVLLQRLEQTDIAELHADVAPCLGDAVAEEREQVAGPRLHLAPWCTPSPNRPSDRGRRRAAGRPRRRAAGSAAGCGRSWRSAGAGWRRRRGPGTAWRSGCVSLDR